MDCDYFKKGDGTSRKFQVSPRLLASIRLAEAHYRSRCKADAYEAKVNEFRQENCASTRRRSNGMKEDSRGCTRCSNGMKNDNPFATTRRRCGMKKEDENLREMAKAVDLLAVKEAAVAGYYYRVCQ